MLRISVARVFSYGRLLKLAAHCVCLGMAAVSGVALAEIAQSPLFLPVPPPPNIMYMLDNSGSMVWGTVTGTDATVEFNAGKTQLSYYSSAWNQIYYNPATTYTPGVKANGTSMGNASTTATIIDPYLNPGTKLTNIGAKCYYNKSFTLPFYNTNFSSINCGASGANSVAQYAFYYNWIGRGTPTGAIGEDTDKYYTRIDIVSGNVYPRVASRTDCAGATCTYAEEIQNFANWFSYYRTRILLTKTSLGTVFSGINDRFRVGFGTINDNASNFVPISTFNAAQKSAWYAKLYAIKPNGATPLIDALNQVGQYYMGKPMNGAPSSTPDPIQLKCQANYTILATDGYWNGTVPSSIGNQDKLVPALPAPVSYDPVSGGALKAGDPFPAPFHEGSTGISNSLADAAMKYWITDIGVRGSNGGTAGKITATSTDPATWQHMTTHTIGLGANGNLIYQADYKTATSGHYAEIKQGKRSWGIPKENTDTAIDDLWHAAVNGHGSYFSAKNPKNLQDGLNSILAEIGRASGSGGNASVPGGAVPGGKDAVAYVPSFDSGSWTGHLKAHPVDAKGKLDPTPKWDAATLLPDYEKRNIVTWNPTTKSAKKFVWENLTVGTDSQQAALVSANVLDYLKGSSAMEKAPDGSGAGVYRYRQNKLGDIVNSTPLYIKSNDFGYTALPASIPGGSTYNAFLTTKAARSGMLYVGANDGMLHGFDTSGTEKFAFIPNSVYPNLKTLSDLNYGHHYFVDGPLAEGDAYVGGAWKNILLGSTGAGAQSVFSIDVTKTDGLAESSVLWEYNATASDADMGNVLGAPAVVLLANNKWAAIFGNGYNSANGHAVLYLVDIQTGALIKKIDTGVGSATAQNGLSAPALLFNASRQLIAAYAGDLQGNLWKFDLSNASDAQWNRSTLFTAKDQSSVPKVQPIVQAPVIAPHPLGGFMVLFGTGKYFETEDLADTNVQSLYGIWDKPGANAVTGRSQLQVQTLTDVSSKTGELLGRTLSTNTVAWSSKRGWYIDYPSASGERTVGALRIIKDVIVLTTSLTPNTADPCAGGGSSQILGANFLSGAYTDKFHLIVADTPPNVNLSSAKVPGTVGTALPVPNPDVTQPGCINTIGSDGKPHCQEYLTTGVAVRRWRQLSIKPN
ncbi:Type IV fimbrial biogenesis protein PilY1 [Collimonas arenae]|uniref:Type IV fimbrial biogenesis protein PilY1 n=1 Tax=Collimonas arenae TaxID=279058 RepID=A0A0A1FFK8_9BURK|nr:PilC/PilY family type IV pilus protein [Collimonas arenae]AIY43276.1 Type IV fimbrial biogenesis protein PilY1 [Collimonas arenae]